MHSFLKRLAKEELSALWIRHVLEDRQCDVVPHKTLSCAEESKVTHDHSTLIVAQAVRLPKLDVFSHRHLCWKPIIGASVKVVFPRPLVLERHKLVYIYGAAVNDSLIIHINALCYALGIFFH